MTVIQFLSREITKEELAYIDRDFEFHQMEFGNPIQPQTRCTFVAMDKERLVGCVSGLRDNNWYYLSNLWLEKAYRKRGLGQRLLAMWEQRLIEDGVKHVYTWTAGYEAPGFYKKQGYEIFVELEDYFPAGHSRVGLRKNLLAS